MDYGIPFRVIIKPVWWSILRRVWTLSKLEFHQIDTFPNSCTSNIVLFSMWRETNKKNPSLCLYTKSVYIFVGTKRTLQYSAPRQCYTLHFPSMPTSRYLDLIWERNNNSNSILFSFSFSFLITQLKHKMIAPEQIKLDLKRNC